MVNAINVELDVITVNHDHYYAEGRTGTTAEKKERLDKTAVCRNQTSRNRNFVVLE